MYRRARNRARSRAHGRRRVAWLVPPVLLVALAVGAAAADGDSSIQHRRAGSDWPVFGYNEANTNANVVEGRISPESAPFLRRQWETFNDDELNPEPRPTGFVLESVLGLEYPASCS